MTFWLIVAFLATGQFGIFPTPFETKEECVAKASEARGQVPAVWCIPIKADERIQ
jgi:hypothetical protein